MRALRRRFARMLRLEGFEVKTAVNAETGLHEAEEYHPDAIILDLRMPLVDGLGFLRRLREPRTASDARWRSSQATISSTTRFRTSCASSAPNCASSRCGSRIWSVLARTLRQGDALNDAGSPVPESLPAAAGRRHAGLVHAPGRALHERVPLPARALFAARYLPHARSRHGSDAAASTPHRGGRRDPLFRFAAAARAHGHPFRFRQGRRAGDRDARCARRPTSRACVASSRARAVATCSRPSARFRRELAGRVPLIGFAGAPFTLASYAIEGGHSTSFAHTKALMYGAPAAWHRFCDLLADIVADYLVAQIEAGVDAVQVFDSWVGALNAHDYREFILPHTKQDLRSPRPTRRADRSISASAPASILGELREAGGDVIGADWRTPLDEAWARIGVDRGIQGNLDPTLLLGPLDRDCSPRPTTCSSARAGGPATSSISVTAFCRRRPSSTSRRSRGTCISKRRI